MQSRAQSRRPSTDLTAQLGGIRIPEDYSTASELADFFGTDMTTFSIFDNWDWNLDSGMPTYGGFGFGDDFTLPL